MVSAFLMQPGKIKVTDEMIARTASRAPVQEDLPTSPLHSCAAPGLCRGGQARPRKPPSTVSQLWFEVRPTQTGLQTKVLWWCAEATEAKLVVVLPAASHRDSLVSRSAVRTFLARCFPVCPPLLQTQAGVWVSAGVLLPLLVTAGPPLFIITVLRAAPFISLPGSCIFIGFVCTFALLSPRLHFVSAVVVAAARALRLPLLFPLMLLLFLFLLPGGFLWSLREAFLCVRLGLFHFSVLGFLLGRAFATKKKKWEQKYELIRCWLGIVRLKV